MKLLLQEIRRNPLLWLLVFVPIALAAEKLNHPEDQVSRSKNKLGKDHRVRATTNT